MTLKSGKKLKIAVSFHKETLINDYIKNKDIYIPIFGGKELYKGDSLFLLNMIGDNTGNNISTLNPNLNEGTILYWFAKHLNEFGDPDYIGFEYYKKFLIFDLNDLNLNTIIANKYNLIHFSIMLQLCQQEMTFENLSFYVNFINNLNPLNMEIFKEFLNSKEYYASNMFIMPKQIFEEYKKFLFMLIDFSKLILKYKPLFINYNPKILAIMLEKMTGYFIFQKEKQDIKIINKNVIVPLNEQNLFLFK